jgi:hypothetical protein
MMGRMPPAVPGLAVLAWALAGVVAAAAGEALARSGDVASTGLMVPIAALFVRAALRRTLTPPPFGRARVRLGDLALPLLPVTPARRFGLEFAGNLVTSGGWIALGVLPVVLILQANGLGLSAGLAVAPAAWLMGSIPLAGPGRWPQIAVGTGFLVALLPAALTGVSDRELPIFAPIAMFALLIGYTSAVPPRSPAAARAAQTTTVVGRTLVRATQLEVRPAESAEARLRRLARLRLGRLSVNLVGTGVAVFVVTTALTDSEAMRRSVVSNIGYIFWAVSESAVIGFAGLVVGTRAPTGRPGLTTAFCLPLATADRLRLATRFALACGLPATLSVTATVVLLGTDTASAVFPIGFVAAIPFVRAGLIAAGAAELNGGALAIMYLGAMGPGMIAAGAQLQSFGWLFIGMILTTAAWLPAAIRGVRVAFF